MSKDKDLSPSVSAELQAAMSGDPSDLGSKIKYRAEELTKEELSWIARIVRGEIQLPRRSFKNVKQIVAAMIDEFAKSEGISKKDSRIDVIRHALATKSDENGRPIPISREHAYRVLKGAKDNLSAIDGRKLMSKNDLETES